MIYIVTQSKRKENKLLYDTKTSEYIYIHYNVVKWRISGDDALLEHFRALYRGEIFASFTQDKENYPIFKKYCDDCEYNAKLLNANCLLLRQ